MDYKHSPQTIYIIQIHDCASYSAQQTKILYDILHHGNNLFVAIMLLATETKVKKKLNTNEFLVYYHSPILLPSITNELVSVFNSYDDPHTYIRVNADSYYHTIGVQRLKTLNLAESRYLIDLLNKIPTLIGEKHAHY
jgi:hypothetical protein